MKRILLLATVLVIGLQLSAQKNSLLWKISGKKLEQPSYLYGTIHIQDENVFAFDSIIYEKLAACDAFAMELIMDDIQPSVLRKSMLMEEGSIKDYLTDEEYEILDSVMLEATGQSLALFLKMKPFFLSSQIMQAQMPKDMPVALDLHFLDKARKANKKVYGIEELEDQIGAIDALSIEDQMEMLMEGITDTSSINSMEQFDNLMQAYIAQDLDSIFKISTDTALPSEFNKEFLIKRNKKMAKQIIRFSKKHSTFSAIGAAHLPGPKGVIRHLRKRGYTVEPVPFRFDTTQNVVLE